MTLTPEQEARRQEMVQEAGIPSELKPITGLVVGEEWKMVVNLLNGAGLTRLPIPVGTL